MDLPIRFQDLPSEVLQHICVQLDSVDDVLNLQNVHPRIERAIDFTFWRLPRVLRLGFEFPKRPGQSTIRLQADNDHFELPNDVETLRVVLDRCSRINELCLAPYIQLSHRDQKYALDLLRKSGIRLKRITASFEEPSNSVRDPDALWPNFSIRKRICSLVSSQRCSLQNLLFKFSPDKFVCFERNSSKLNLSVHIAFQSEVNVFVQALYPIITAFHHHSACPRSVSIIIDVEDSRAHLALQDAIHSIPHPHRDGIRDLRIHLPHIASQDAVQAVVNSFESYLCQLGGLRSLSWFLSNAEQLKSCFPKVNALNSSRFSTFVSTPNAQIPMGNAPIISHLPNLIECL
ncbi:hypothetical protein L596_007517 [Steinernema carpocapsae]|uniref:F-box domain-containing protein n=1 Tax=Steinernema carpocapsae TaxID=34508 RepID=A0A4U5PAK2_STECR|nr:hypothetical protein L596_007517 [Steinernema carpocapsae]